MLICISINGGLYVIAFIHQTLDSYNLGNIQHGKTLKWKAGKLVSEYLFNYSKEKNIFMKVNYVNPEHVHAFIDQPTNLSQFSIYPAIHSLISQVICQTIFQ